MEPYLAMIFLFGGNFAIRGFAICAGQIMAISQNAALFSLLGTTYGGNGQTTFALPDLRGRVPIGQGQGPGLSNNSLGQVTGTESTNILITNLPQHNHTFAVSSATGTTGIPGNTTYLSKAPSSGSGPNAVVEKLYTTTAPDTTLAPLAVGLSGGNQPISIMQPYLVLNYEIALEGIFPSRN